MFDGLIFLVSALLTLASCIGMLFVKNIMYNCMLLLATLLGVAGLYASMGADFVAVAQIMVYVGGVVILMLFAVMLTGGKDFISRAQNLLGLISSHGNKWSFSIAGAMAFILLLILGRLVKHMTTTSVQSIMDNSSTVNKIGKLLITDHVLAFELSSVLILGALVGAATIARSSGGSK